jgi:carbamoyltransferase
VDIARSIQEITEEVVLRLARTARERTGKRNLCLSGGVALNCVANGKLLRERIFDDIWIQPAAGDAGSAVGAAFAAWHGALGKERRAYPDGDSMQGTYLGPEFSREQIRSFLDAEGCVYTELAPGEWAGTIAEHIVNEKVVGLFQGRMEFGPRALGNRSILAHPAYPGVADRVNQAIKFREKWRPFCPSLLESASPDILGTDHASPFMAIAFDISDAWRARIPEVVHVDGTGRPQTVSEEQNPLYHRLIRRFEERTGLPVLLNTSLNRRGEPMVCSPDDALDMFYGSGLEHLFLGPYYVKK